MACDPSRFCYDWEEVTTVPFFFYKNIFYKNIEAEIWEILRIL